MLGPKNRKIIKDNRFLVESHINSGGVSTITDTVTGVQYIAYTSASGGVTMTPLLGKDGKPLVVSTSNDEDSYNTEY